MLVEVGIYGISFIWFHPDPFSVIGVKMYSFSRQLSQKILIEHIKELCANSSFKQKSVTICFNYQDSLIIPVAYYEAKSVHHLLNLIFGLKNYTILQDDLREAELLGNTAVKNVYRVAPEIHEMMLLLYPTAHIKHSSSLQINNNDLQDGIRCIVYQQWIKVFLYDNGIFKFVQYFFYKTPTDVAYHLLNTCNQHSVNAELTHIQISGMIDKDSSLYRELSKYFSNLTLISIPQLSDIETSIVDSESHFYSHLIQLAQCVS